MGVLSDKQDRDRRVISRMISKMRCTKIGARLRDGSSKRLIRGVLISVRPIAFEMHEIGRMIDPANGAVKNFLMISRSYTARCEPAYFLKSLPTTLTSARLPAIYVDSIS